MRVLVTGCFGYLGPVIVKHLKAAGHEVVGLDTGWFLGNYAEMPVWPDETLWLDLRDAAELVLMRYSGAEQRQPDAVVHLAGLSNDPLGDLDPALTEKINVGGTLDLISLLPNARHVVVSSCSVYGANDTLATTDTPVNPLTAYARGKAEVDRLATRYADDVISLRLGTVWGYSPGHRLDLVVNRMMFDVVHRDRVTAIGNAWRPLVHVEDVARAVTDCVDSDEQGIRNVVGENVQMQELAYRIGDEFAEVEVICADGGGDTRNYRAHGEGIGTMRSVFSDEDLHDLWVNTQLLPVVSAIDPTDRYTRLNSIRRLRNLGLLDENLRRIN